MIAAVFCVFLCASCANLVSVLPAHTCRKQGRKRSLRNVPAVVLAAVIATLADHAVRQWRAPARQAPPPWPGVDPADPQHAQELHALHHEPSDEFCAAGPPLVCAHGGDTSGGAPANSLEAFQAALQRGVPCLEVDVARTSDGRLVVLHPRDLAQLLRHAGQPSEASDAGEAADEQQLPQVGDYSWEQLAALSWPGGQRVGAAEEVLQLAVPAAQHITLDVKTHTGQVGCVLAALPQGPSPCASGPVLQHHQTSGCATRSIPATNHFGCASKTHQPTPVCLLEMPCRAERTIWKPLPLPLWT